MTSKEATPVQNQQKSELVLWAEMIARPLPIAAGLVGGIIIYATYPIPVFPKDNYQLVKDLSALGTGVFIYFVSWLTETAVHSYFACVENDLGKIETNLENTQRQLHQDPER